MHEYRLTDKQKIKFIAEEIRINRIEYAWLLKELNKVIKENYESDQ